MYATYFTPFLQDLGWSSQLIGVFFALFAVFGFFFAPLVGALSDTLGRFKLIMFGIAVEVVSLIGYILATDVYILLALRIVSSFSYTAVTVSAMARVEDSVDDEKERSAISGVYTSAQAVATLAAPIIGGIIADSFGYRANFMVSMGVMILLLVGILIYDKFKFSDDYPHRKNKPFEMKTINPFQTIKELFKKKELRSICILGTAANIQAPLRHVIIPLLVIDKFGMSNTSLSYLILIFGVLHVFQFYFGRLADKYRPERFIVYGNMVFVLCLLALIFVNSYVSLAIVIFVYALAGSFWNVSAWGYMSRLGEKYKMEGKVVGGYIALAHKSHTISFIITGFLLQFGFAVVYIVYAAVIGVAIAYTYKSFMSNVRT